MKFLIPIGIVLVGGLVGFGWAKLVGCRDGSCPLTATPWRGAAVGLALGLLFAFNSASLNGATAGPAAAESTAIVHPKDATAFAALVASGTGKTVLVDFYADWCGPCRRFGPELSKYADAHKDKVVVVKVNVDDHADLARKYGVSGIPAIRLFRDGKLVAQASGAMNTDELENWVSNPK